MVRDAITMNSKGFVRTGNELYRRLGYHREQFRTG